MVKSILTNENYKGNALLQKVYTSDFLTKKKIKNDGQVPQYYVENNYPAIIEPGVLYRVQKLMSIRYLDQSATTSAHVPAKSNAMNATVGTTQRCGAPNTSTEKSSSKTTTNFDRNSKCRTPHITEDGIHSLFIKAMNILDNENDAMIKDFETINDTIFYTTELL